MTLFDLKSATASGKRTSNKSSEFSRSIRIKKSKIISRGGLQMLNFTTATAALEDTATTNTILTANTL